MESLVARGVIHGVLDMTIAEIGAHLVGGLHDAGPGRLDAICQAGIPPIPWCCRRWRICRINSAMAGC